MSEVPRVTRSKARSLAGRPPPTRSTASSMVPPIMGATTGGAGDPTGFDFMSKIPSPVVPPLKTQKLSHVRPSVLNAHAFYLQLKDLYI